MWVRSGSEHWPFYFFCKAQTRYVKVHICVERSQHALPCLLWSGVRAGYTVFCPSLLFLYLASWGALQSRASGATTVSCCFSCHWPSWGNAEDWKAKAFPFVEVEGYCFTLGFEYILSDSYGILSICGTFKALPLTACRLRLNFKYFSTRPNSARDSTLTLAYFCCF